VGGYHSSSNGPFDSMLTFVFVVAFLLIIAFFAGLFVYSRSTVDRQLEAHRKYIQAYRLCLHNTAKTAPETWDADRIKMICQEDARRFVYENP
jgi:hypothetical protein